MMRGNAAQRKVELSGGKSSTKVIPEMGLRRASYAEPNDAQAGEWKEGH